MAQLVVAAAGAAIGSSIGGTFLGMTASNVGFLAGSFLGSALFGPKAPNIEAPSQPLMDLRVTGTEYGQAIPYVRGVMSVAGQLWWNTDRRANTTTTTTSAGGGKGGGGGGSVTSSSTTYDMDALYGLTGNPIVGIARIWRNGELIYTADSGASGGSIVASQASGAWARLTVYTGEASQLPDPTYEAAVGSDEACAYRGRGSVFIEGLQLGSSGAVPNLTFEVVVEGTAVSVFDPDTAATFDEARKNSRITLSNGDLTATADSNLSSKTVIGSVSKSSGKFYCEVTLTASTGTEAFGLAGAGVNAAAFDIGFYADGYEWAGGSGGVAVNNNTVIGAYGGTFTSGDVISILFDADANTLAFWKNGVDKGVAFSGLTSSYAPGVSLSVNSVVTINFGASAWIYTPPDGFRGWSVSAIGAVSGAAAGIGEVVQDLCVRAGLDAAQVDVTGLTSITREVRAMAISQVQPARATLDMLMSAYFFEMTVSDKLYFRPRGGASVASIPFGDLGATFSTTGDPPEPLQLTQANDLELPAQIALAYINVEMDYQASVELSDRLVSAVADTVTTVQVPLGLTPSEAKAVADTMILDLASAIITTRFAVSSAYAELEPTDAVTVEAHDGSQFRLRITQRTDRFPQLTFEAVLDDVSVLTSQAITSADYTSSTVVQAALDTSQALLDIPILRDADDNIGFYVACKAGDTEREDEFPGAGIYDSPDDVTYTRQATAEDAAVFGTCTTTLGDWTGVRVFDEKNTVTVNVGGGSLESSTRAAVLGSASVNAMLIGSELIQFITATPVSTGVYTLSRLLRGGRGTEWAMSGHAASERCVLLRTAGIRRLTLENAQLGLARYYKSVTFGRAVSTADGEAFTCNAIGLKPFAPFDLRAARDGSNNITFTWQRRTRLTVRTIGALGISIPLGEAVEAYEIDIYSSGTYTTVVRTISASTAAAAYTAAEQTADGLTPGNAVYARVYQLSAAVNRGHALEASA